MIPAPTAIAKPSPPRIHHLYFAHGSFVPSGSIGAPSPPPGRVSVAAVPAAPAAGAPAAPPSPAVAAAPVSLGNCPTPETVKSTGCEGSTFRATKVCAVVSSVTGLYGEEAPAVNVMLFGIITAIVSVAAVIRGANFTLPLYGSLYEI